jgi:hypothetical protein
MPAAQVTSPEALANNPAPVSRSECTCPGGTSGCMAVSLRPLHITSSPLPFSPRLGQYPGQEPVPDGLAIRAEEIITPAFPTALNGQYLGYALIALTEADGTLAIGTTWFLHRVVNHRH